MYLSRAARGSLALPGSSVPIILCDPALGGVAAFARAMPVDLWVSCEGRASWRKVGGGRSGVAVQPQLEVASHVGPFTRKDAVHHDITSGAVAAHAVMANHTVALGSQRLDSLL